MSLSLNHSPSLPPPPLSPAKRSQKNPITVNNTNHRQLLLHHCRTTRDLHQIHAHLIKTSLIHHPPFLESLIETSSLLLSPPNLPYALSLFLSLSPHVPTPHVTQSYNILIRSFTLHRSPSASLLLFLHLLTHSHHPDQHTYSCTLKACSRLPSLPLGQQLHAHAVVSGFAAHDFVANSLIHMYAASGEVAVARNMFDRMNESKRGVVTWNAMCAGYFKAGDWEKVVELFRGMVEMGVEFDEITLISVLTACGKLGVLELGEWIDGFVKGEMGGGSRNLVTALLDMYAKCGRVDRARELFDGMESRDVVAWSAMISGYNQWNRCREALELFNEMQTVANVEANEVTMVSVLSSCSVLGALEMGKWVHSFVTRKRMKLTVTLGTALVDFYAKCGCIEDALDAFMKMPRKNAWTWTVLIQGLASNGRGREALEFFSSMLEAKLEPNDVTFVAVLSACSHAGLVEEGRHYFESMSSDYGIEPRVEHYGCMVDILGRAGLLEEAYCFVEKEMPIKPNAVIWRTLLSACKIHKNVEIGEESLKQIVLLEPKHSGDYILLSNIYASVGRWEDAVEVRNQMKEKGITKIPGCTLMEMAGTIYEFFAEDSAHPESKEIYCKLNEIMGKIKEVGYVPILAEARLDADEEEKEVSVSHHSEKLAIAYGLIKSPPGAVIRISKNLRVCMDCHVATKLISTVYKREIIVRDRNRFHHFKDGNCSCNDYW